MLKRLWLDDAGVILSTELILIMVILVIGLVTGLQALRTAVDVKLADVAGAVYSIDPSYGFSGVVYANLDTLTPNAATAYTLPSEYQSDVNVNAGADLYGVITLTVTPTSLDGSAVAPVISGT
jgi:hypothetical protein